MTARILTIASLKGASGCTTLAVNLAAMAALLGRKVLLVDLDALGGATAALGQCRDDRNDRMPAFSKPEAFAEHILECPNSPGFHLWRGGSMLFEIESRLWNVPDSTRDKVFRKATAKAREHYDWIVIDSPPNYGPVFRNALYAADDILLPISGHAFHCETVIRSLDMLKSLQPSDEGAPPKPTYGVLLGQSVNFSFERLNESCRESLIMLKHSMISDPETIRQAAVRGMALIDFDPRARCTYSLIEIAKELFGHLFHSSAETDASPSPATADPADTAPEIADSSETQAAKQPLPLSPRPT